MNSLQVNFLCAFVVIVEVIIRTIIFTRILIRIVELKRDKSEKVVVELFSIMINMINWNVFSSHLDIIYRVRQMFFNLL